LGRDHDVVDGLVASSGPEAEAQHVVEEHDDEVALLEELSWIFCPTRTSATTPASWRGKLSRLSLAATRYRMRSITSG